MTCKAKWSFQFNSYKPCGIKDPSHIESGRTCIDSQLEVVKNCYFLWVSEESNQTLPGTDAALFHPHPATAKRPQLSEWVGMRHLQARAKRKQEEVFEKSTGGKPNSSPRDRVVFQKTCFLAGPQSSWFSIFLEQTSPDGPIQSRAGGNRGFCSTQIHFPGVAGPLISVSFADKTGLPSLLLTAESQHLYNFL